MLVEVCANSLQSAINAEKGGADRIELCSELGVGGVTPSYGLMCMVKEHVNIPIHVLIRPRSGDFTYSDIEFKQMKINIQLCRELGFQGIVSGVLNANFTINIERTLMLKELAGDMKFTFHRAFDWIKEPLKAMEQLENINVDYVLTSGKQKTAIEGKELLLKLKQNTKSTVLLPGGGINEKNVVWFKESGFNVIHLSGVSFKQTLSEAPDVSMNSVSYIKDIELATTNELTIKNICALVK